MDRLANSLAASILLVARILLAEDSLFVVDNCFVGTHLASTLLVVGRVVGMAVAMSTVVESNWEVVENNLEAVVAVDNLAVVVACSSC
jgi:hypothetical protein